MIPISDIISGFNFLKPKSIEIICSFSKSGSLGRYVFEIYNSGSNSVVITNIEINKKQVWESFSVIEQKKDYPIVIHSKNKFKLNFSIGKGDEFPTVCKLKYKRKLMSDITQEFTL
jgi:hypothetical protein